MTITNPLANYTIITHPDFMPSSPVREIKREREIKRRDIKRKREIKMKRER